MTATTLKFPARPGRPLPKPPRHLTAETRRWFNQVVNEFELEEHHVMILVTAAEFWDRMGQARRVLARKGLTFTDRFGQPHARPEVAIERASKTGFLRALRELALDVSAPDDSRPPGLTGRRR